MQPCFGKNQRENLRKSVIYGARWECDTDVISPPPALVCAGFGVVMGDAEPDSKDLVSFPVWGIWDSRCGMCGGVQRLGQSVVPKRCRGSVLEKGGGSFQ